VISAIRPFVDPKPAEIPGVDDFEGKLIHSARWDHDYDLPASGSRSSHRASAVQIVPSIARDVGRLDVYQRTPIWISPKLDPKIPAWMKRMFRRLPFTERIARNVASAGVEFIIIFMTVNFGRFPWIVRSVERRNRRFLASQVKDPETRRKLTPDYGMAQEASVSNDYLRTFNRANIDLVTEPIERITGRGIRTADGTERDVDALILATGFRLPSTRRTSAAPRCGTRRLRPRHQIPGQPHQGI
jgi:cation diffusion facilitator CzcD-associated flavoprotein CzcO